MDSLRVMETGIITNLETQKRNKERVNVYIDGEFAFALSLIEAAKLQKGQQLTPDDINRLRDEDNIQKAMDRALNFLSYRPRSTNEVRLNLSKKDIPDSVVNAVVERLEAYGYVDDRAFARFWVENRTSFKPRSSRALRYELRQKGIADNLITEVLDEVVDEDAVAYAAAQKRLSRLRGSTQQVFRQKLGSFLQRQGFTYETIRNVISRLMEEIDTEDFFVED